MSAEPLRPWERVVVVVDALLCAGLLLLTAFLVATAFPLAADPDSPHGGAFQILGALIVGPPGLLFGVAAVAVARRWPRRWWWHLPPLLYVALFVTMGL